MPTAPPLRAAVAWAVALSCAFVAMMAAAGPAAAVPKASDFERAVKLPPLTGAVRASGVRTLLIEPGREFELVGFRWKGSAVPTLSLRSYGANGWSAWTSLESDDKDGPDPVSMVRESSLKGSDPVWTGRAWRLQVRVGGKGFREFRAHFVDVTSSRGAVRAAGTGGLAPGTADSPSTMRSAADQPPIVPRAAWGGNSCKPRFSAGYGEVLTTVVHHTESTNSYSQAQASSVVLGICRYHRNSKGWSDVGYNLLIDRFGTVYEGRAGGVDRAVIGAHAQGYNSQTAGVALIGGFMSTEPPAATVASLRQVLEWKLGMAGVTRNERVALISTGGSANRYKWGKTVFTRPIGGHRDLDSTNCPGDVLYAKLPGLATFLTGGPRAVTKSNLRVKRVAQGNGQVVSVAGRLRSGGAAAAGKSVTVEAFTARGWVPLAETKSDETGLWQVTIAPKGRYYLRGVFAGTDDLRPVRTLWLYSPKIKRPT